MPVQKCFLRIGKGYLPADHSSWSGIWKAQIKLACVIHDADSSNESFEDIARSLATNPMMTLIKLVEEMRAVTAKEFWEVNNRQENMDYLTLGQKKQLDVLMTQVKVYASLGTVHEDEEPDVETASSSRRDESRTRGSRSEVNTEASIY